MNLYNLRTIFYFLLFVPKCFGQFAYPTSQEWGTMPNGQKVLLYTFKTEKGASVSITNYGATFTSIIMPDRDSVYKEIITGVDNLAQYQKGTPAYGSTMGRYAGRIAQGKFSLDSNINFIQLFQNDGPHSIHGGKGGFHTRLWKGQIAGNKLILSYKAAHGEGNFPGNYTIEMTISLSETNELRILYQAVTDAPTVHNITNHTYFNLDGFGKKPSILNHQIKIEADSIVELQKGKIPTGKIIAVQNTALDFRNFETIGKRIDLPDSQLQLVHGYDHYYIMNSKENELKLMATVKSDKVGRQLKVYSSEPGVQFFTGNNLSKKSPHRKGQKYQNRAAFCLETMHFPDSPNHTHFPSTLLLPQQKFKSVTVYKFEIVK